MSTVIDTAALAKVVLYALVATTGVSIVFGLAILGASQATERRREGRLATAAAFGALATAGVLASLGAMVLGVLLLTQK